MILWENIHYLILVAFFVFTFTLYIKMYGNVGNLYYTFKGVCYFLLFTFIYPFMISNDIYSKRNAMNRRIAKDDKLSSEQKKKMKRFVNSRFRLYSSFTIWHILGFPRFIETFSTAYAKWYKERLSKNNDKKSSPLEEMKKIGFGKFPNLFNTMKQRFS